MLRRLAIDNHVFCAILLRIEGNRRSRIDNERRPQNNAEVTVDGLGFGIHHLFFGHGLTERDGGGFQQPLAKYAGQILTGLIARLEVLIFIAFAAVQAFGVTGIAVNLDDALIFNASMLVEIIDILGDLVKY
mgnify:CR=1 FL=1